MKYIPIICSIILSSLFSCSNKPKNNTENIIDSSFNFANKQLTHAFTEIEIAKNEALEKGNKSNLINPRTISEDGSLKLVPSTDWTSGFFPGELWYMYEYTKDKKWETAARKYTDPLEREKSNGRTHDMGFKVYCSFGNGYRLTKDNNYRKILLEAAYTLTTRYKEHIGLIRSWDHSSDKWQYPVIIDNMMNLELLFWAYNETKDSLFYDIAVNHAQKTMKEHFRKDYSSFHVIDYDTITGTVVNKHTHQGYSHESAWARGQAWGLYGYTVCYRETKLPEFLEQAKQIANYIFTHPNMPQDLIPYWDFNAPHIPNEPKDVSAATVSASALYELSLYDKENAKQYITWANTILSSLNNNYLATEGADRGFLLLHSTGGVSFEKDTPLVYADYYYLEALLRKQKLEVTGKIF